MQPMNPEKQHLHNKRLHKSLCPIIKSSYSATYSAANYDGVAGRKQINQCGISWKTKGKNLHKLKQAKKLSTKPQKPYQQNFCQAIETNDTQI